jgi:hypothetical protein
MYLGGLSISLSGLSKILYRITVIVMSSVRVAMIGVSFWQLKNRQYGPKTQEIELQ